MMPRCHACTRPSVEEIAKVHETFAVAFEPDKSSAVASTTPTWPHKGEAFSLVADALARVRNFLESLRISSYSPTSASADAARLSLSFSLSLSTAESPINK